MAQSQSNLNLTIGADTSKARADLDALNAKIRQTRKEIGDLTKAGDTAGVSRLTQEQEKLYQQQAKLTQVTKADTVARRENTRANIEGAVSTREFTKYMIEFGKEAGISNLSVRGLRLGLAGLVVAATVRTIGDAIKQINELSIAAKEAGTTVGTIQGLQSAFRAAGDDAKKAAPLLTKFFQAARESRLTQREIQQKAGEAFSEALAKPGEELEYDPTGHLLRRIRTHAEATDAMNKRLKELQPSEPRPGEDPFGWLRMYGGMQLRPEDYKQTPEGQAQLRRDSAAALLKAKDQPGLIDEAQIVSLKLYGQELAVIVPELQKIATGKIQFPEPSPNAVQTMEEYNTLMGRFGDAAAKSADQVGRLGAALAVAFSGTGKIGAQAFTELAVSTGGAGGGFATGGYVRGPGTGTSDSIPARLSNGEFVLNADSVRHLGVGFLQGLNSFAMGGLVGPPPIRFAAGGLVSAASSSGRPVHLHLGSSSFALSGSSGVVDALVSHAHGQQMRSAGVKPSWFAGRPSGR